MNLVLPSENTHTNTQPHISKSKWVREDIAFGVERLVRCPRGKG